MPWSSFEIWPKRRERPGLGQKKGTKIPGILHGKLILWGSFKFDLGRNWPKDKFSRLLDFFRVNLTVHCCQQSFNSEGKDHQIKIAFFSIFWARFFFLLLRNASLFLWLPRPPVHPLEMATCVNCLAAINLLQGLDCSSRKPARKMPPTQNANSQSFV